MAHAVRGQGRIGAGHLERRGLLGPDDHRREGVVLLPQAEALGHLHHLVEPHRGCHALEGAVDGPRRCRLHGHVPAAWALGVLDEHRPPPAGAVPDNLARARSVDGRLRAIPRFEGGQQREQLEGRARLAAGGVGGDVVLELVEAGSPHHRPDVAGGGLDGGHGGDGTDPVLGDDVADGGILVRLGLHGRVEGGEDLQSAPEHRVVALRRGRPEPRVVQQRLLEVLDEIALANRVVDAQAGRDRLQRELLGLVGRQMTEVDHALEGHIAPIGGGLGALQRVVAEGVADDAGQECRLLGLQLADRLVEIRLRRRLHAVDAVAEVDEVQVPLEDLVLAHFLLEAGGQDRFFDLSVDGPFWPEEGVLDDLLGDGRPALADGPGAGVGEERSGHGLQVYATVAVEAVVLDVENGVADQHRHLFQRDRLAVHLRLERRENGAVGVIDDRRLIELLQSADGLRRARQRLRGHLVKGHGQDAGQLADQDTGEHDDDHELQESPHRRSG